MRITFGGFFRNMPATIMRCGRTFRLARTHPAHARSSGSETLSRGRSLADYTIDTHESEFSEATGWDVKSPKHFHGTAHRNISFATMTEHLASRSRLGSDLVFGSDSGVRAVGIEEAVNVAAGAV